MSLDSLNELVSVTSNAVRSLDKSSSSGGSDKIRLRSAGSPFDSPRSIKSLSEKHEKSRDVDSGVGKTQSSAKNDSDKPENHAIHGTTTEPDKDDTETGVDLEEDATVIEIIPWEPANKVSSHPQSVDPSDEHVNISSSSSQKVSVSIHRLREIPCPEESGDHASDRSKGSGKQKTDVSKSFPNKAKFFAERSMPANVNNNRVQSEGEESGSGHDLCNDQPEIIDVPERIVAITSGMSSTSGEDSSFNIDMIDKVGEANKPAENRFTGFGKKSFGKIVNAQSHGLKQGALHRGDVDPTKTSLFDDVYISQFELTDRQKGLKEALAKRSENNKPKKKYVQPQIICNKHPVTDDTDVDSQRSQLDSARVSTTSADPAITAAAAASAAVAATQPFLKAQQDLETKMQQLLSQLADVQQKKLATDNDDQKNDSQTRIASLERQVTELNERRIEHLENLQQQQLQMQAQLLFMSRSKSPSSRMFHTKRKASPPRQAPTSRIPQAVTNRAAQSTTRTLTNINPSQYRYQARTPSSQPILNPATLSKHHNYLNEVRELQGSHLDTPAPREKVPTPMPYTLPQEPQKSLAFLEELLAQRDNPVADTTFSVKGGYSPPTKLDSNRNNSSRGKRLDQSPVDQARRLITSVSNLDRETSESVWGSKDRLNRSDLMDIELGPAPLEKYLKYPEKEGSPYPKLSHHSKEKKARLQELDNLLEAKNVLRHLEVTRETLEKNIDQVVRSRRDMHVFSTLMGSAPEGETDEQLRIQKMVNRKISALQGDVQKEVLKGLAQEEADRLATEAEMERQKLAAKHNLMKQPMAKSGTLRGQAAASARLAYGKTNLATTSTLASRGKENLTSKVKVPPKPAAIKDERKRVQTYGKPEYQRGRTTIRDPYLHFQNTKKGVAGKASVTVLNESAVSRDGRSRSPKGKLGQVLTPTPRQFYFSPTRGYIPLGVSDTAVAGQLVTMAVPLGEPRLEPGVRRSMTIRPSDPITSTPVPVTAARNVAMVSFPVEDERGRGEVEREPELTTQVLPPIDIDSITPTSSRRSDIQIRSPQQGNANVTFLYDTHREDDDLDKTITEEDSDLEQSGEGINLPGYEPKREEYSGPSFPPRTSKPGPGWMAGGGGAPPTIPMSDVMAEDLRRRDLLENNAVQWLEQELMAKVLSQVMPLQLPERQGTANKAPSVTSEDELERDNSLLVADVIGQGGMQLFIDAGQPVDNGLVQMLVREVIQEKVNGMLAQRPAEGEGRAGGRIKDEMEQAMEEREKVFTGPPPIPTPEPTPKTSPVPSPRRTRQPPAQPATPPVSPPPDGYRFKQPPASELPEVLREPVRQPQRVQEPQPDAQTIESESEASVSIDISEELRRVAAKGKPFEPEGPAVFCHDVTTPPISPPPRLEQEKPIFTRQATPPASPPPALPSLPRAKTPPPREPVREEVQEEVEDEEEEEEELEQPQPIMMSIAVGEDRPMSAEKRVKSRSPSPKRPRTPVSTMSETSPISSDTSVTETVNDILSEGQWLLSRSEGQLVGAVNYEAIRKEVMKRGYQGIVDVSTASTLRDTDDLDLDEAGGTKSEGEFLYSQFPDPDQDPMLEVLADMQKKQFTGAHSDLPLPYVRQILSGPAPQEVMSATGRSLGEMSVGQVPPSRVAMGHMGQERKSAGRRQKGHRSPARSPSPAMERRVAEEYRYEEERRERRKEGRKSSSDHQQRSRTPSPLQQQQQQHQRSRTPPQQEGRSRTPPQYQMSAGRSRPRGQMQYQPVLSEGAPTATRGRSLSGQRYSGQRSSDSRVSRSSDQGSHRSSYHSDSVSRSAESPSLRRSENGLTSSFKSRQSGAKKSVEFDLSGTYGSRGERPNVRGSRESSGRLSDPSRSLGLTYSFDEALDDSELKRIVDGTSTGGTEPYRMSVTLPSTMEGEEGSELSEIDLSER